MPFTVLITDLNAHRKKRTVSNGNNLIRFDVFNGFILNQKGNNRELREGFYFDS